MLLKWCLAVSSLILKCSAISLLAKPATTAETISSSRGVSPNLRCRASCAVVCISVRRYCTRLELFHKLNSLVAVGGFGNYLKAGLGFEQALETIAKNWMIIG